MSKKDFDPTDLDKRPRDDGGPAFPVVHAIVAEPGQWASTPPAIPGMSLRDYFAAAALAVIPGDVSDPHGIRMLVTDAYAIADAMIAERAK